MAKKILEEKFPDHAERFRRHNDRWAYMSTEPDDTGDPVADSEAHAALSREFKERTTPREAGIVSVQQMLEAILLELRAQRAILAEIRDKEA